MQVNVISDTIQEFDGLRYYLCGLYFQRDGVRLHRVVWQSFNGREIPDGWHVHHADHDRSNNQPDNLRLITAAEHMRHHHEGKRTEMPPEASEAARAWHGSEKGRDWHKEHYEKHKHKLHAKASFTCEQCGSEFNAKKTGQNSFCSNKCKSAWRREKGLDDVVRACINCGKEFAINKYRTTKTCSRKCSGAVQSRTKIERNRRLLPNSS